MDYIVKDPQGNPHIISGPEGATPEQVVSRAKSLIPNPSFRDRIEPGIMGETNPTGQRIIQNLVEAGNGFGMGELGGLGIKGISKGFGKIASKVNAIRNAPKVLEEAVGAMGDAFGTAQTPSMIGNTAREGLASEQTANEVLAQKLYGQVPKDVPVSMPRLSAKYQELSDEIPQTLGNTVKKHIQLEPNPIRPGDVGEFNGVINDIPPSEVVRPSSLVDKSGNPLTFKESIPGRTEYGIGYSASPGTPTQLPPNNPLVGELIKLRSKLGAAARSGGIDGYNAGQLKNALEEDLSNLGSGEGPLGKMTNDVVNESLGKATNYYREMMGQQRTPLYRRLETGKIEDIPEMVFRNGRTQDVLEAKAALGQQGFNAIKKAFFNELVKSKDIVKTMAKYSENNSDFLSSVFNPLELKSLKTVADLQKKAMASAKTIQRAKGLATAAGVAAVGGGIAGKAIKLGMGN